MIRAMSRMPVKSMLDVNQEQDKNFNLELRGSGSRLKH